MILTFEEQQNLFSMIAEGIAHLDSAGSAIRDETASKAIDELLAARHNIDNVLKYFPEKAIEAGYAELLGEIHNKLLEAARA